LLVSVLGATRPEGGEVDEMHLRLRLQNPTQQPLRLPLERQKLLAGDLLDYGAPYLRGGATEAAPGQSVLADLAFPMPAGDETDVRSLTLGWVLEVEGAELHGTLGFQRLIPSPSYDPWGPYGPWGPYDPSWGCHGDWCHVH